jgi:hypothetical protein
LVSHWRTYSHGQRAQSCWTRLWETLGVSRPMLVTGSRPLWSWYHPLESCWWVCRQIVCAFCGLFPSELPHHGKIQAGCNWAYINGPSQPLRLQTSHLMMRSALTLQLRWQLCSFRWINTPATLTSSVWLHVWSD